MSVGHPLVVPAEAPHKARAGVVGRRKQRGVAADAHRPDGLGAIRHQLSAARVLRQVPHPDVPVTISRYELALVRDVRPGETAAGAASRGGGALAEYLATAGASDRRVFEDGTSTVPAGKRRGSD